MRQWRRRFERSAAFLDASDEFGSIRPGLRADLVLLTANPLPDIAATKTRAGMMVRGQWFPQARLDEMLDSLATRYRDVDESTPH